MNLNAVTDTMAPPHPLTRSQTHHHQTTASTSSIGQQSLEALVAALPDNVLFGEGTLEHSDRDPPLRSRLKSQPNPTHSFKSKRRRSPGRVRLGQRIKWVHGNFLEPLPFPDGYFDYV